MPRDVHSCSSRLQSAISRDAVANALCDSRRNSTVAASPPRSRRDQASERVISSLPLQMQNLPALGDRGHNQSWRVPVPIESRQPAIATRLLDGRQHANGPLPRSLLCNARPPAGRLQYWHDWVQGTRGRFQEKTALWRGPEADTQELQARKQALFLVAGSATMGRPQGEQGTRLNGLGSTVRRPDGRRTRVEKRTFQTWGVCLGPAAAAAAIGE